MISIGRQDRSEKFLRISVAGGDPGVSGQQAQSEVKSEEILLGNNLSLGSPGSSVTLQRPPRGGSELQVSQVWRFPGQAVIVFLAGDSQEREDQVKPGEMAFLYLA